MLAGDVEEQALQVLKRGGNSEPFDRSKLVTSLLTACAKRPVSLLQVEAMVDEIEDALSRQARVEVPSTLIGEMVMEKLKPLDRVAYVRFASVYRQFSDLDHFLLEVKRLAKSYQADKVNRLVKQISPDKKSGGRRAAHREAKGKSLTSAGLKD